MPTNFTTMRDLAAAFAKAMNLISPEVENHTQQVAYLSYRLAEALGMNDVDRVLTLYGALFHDVGSVYLMQDEKITLADVERNAPSVARAGAALLRSVPKTSILSPIVEGSQTPFRRLRELAKSSHAALLKGQVIHLADTLSLLLTPEGSILNQVSELRNVILKESCDEFGPAVLKAFDEVSREDAVWLDLFYQPARFLDFLPTVPVSLDETIHFTQFVSQIIDFRSPFTAMHSAGVAASAVALAQLIGMSDTECKMMQIAGNLHDLGKLKISRAILEKPGKLTDEEFNVIKEHAYFSYMLLKDVQGFGEIAEWAAFHHEKLNGMGYPFRLREEQIPLGSRVMAVADIFSAITEERPYRKGMSKEQALSVLRQNVESGAISPRIVRIMEEHYEEIDAQRDAASRAMGKRYFESISKEREKTALPEGK